MRRLAIALAAGALAVAGCGGDEAKKDTGIPSDRKAATPEATVTPDAAALKDTSKKPEIAKPEGAPPAELETQDIVKGKGPRAKTGDQVSMQYVGVAFTTGEQFDASWDRGEPFDFQL